MSNNNEQKKPNIHASYLGKLSAKAHKKMGHGSEYYRQLSNKRWNKAKSKQNSQAKSKEKLQR